MAQSRGQLEKQFTHHRNHAIGGAVAGVTVLPILGFGYAGYHGAKAYDTHKALIAKGKASTPAPRINASSKTERSDVNSTANQKGTTTVRMQKGRVGKK